MSRWRSASRGHSTSGRQQEPSCATLVASTLSRRGGDIGRRRLNGGAGQRGSVTAAGLKRAGPTTPTPVYPDTWLDRQLLKQFHRRVAAELGEDPDSATGDYDETMRRCVKLVSSARTAAEAQARGERVLRALLPPGFPKLFKWFIGLFPGWFAVRASSEIPD